MLGLHTIHGRGFANGRRHGLRPWGRMAHRTVPDPEQALELEHALEHAEEPLTARVDYARVLQHGQKRGRAPDR